MYDHPSPPSIDQLPRVVDFSAPSDFSLRPDSTRRPPLLDAGLAARVARIRAEPIRSAAEIDAEYDRDLAEIIAGAHAGNVKRERDERHARVMADIAAQTREAILRGAAMTRTDMAGAARYLAVVAAVVVAHKSLQRRQYRAACRDCSIRSKEKGTPYSSRDTAFPAPRQNVATDDGAPVVELHGPRDQKARAEWEAIVRHYQRNAPQRTGCQAWTIGQQAFDFSKFRALTVHCGCWDCGVCGPRVAAMWHQHLLPYLREAGPLWLVQVEAKAWPAFARRVQRARGDHVRAMRPDGGYVVLTTVEAPGAVAVEPGDAERTLGAMLANVPSKASGAARRITTSAGWKMAQRRGAKKAEPIVEAASPAVATQWQTVTRAPVTPEQIKAVLEDEGVAFTVRGNGRKMLVTEWATTDQVKGARVWARIFAPRARRMAA